MSRRIAVLCLVIAQLTAAPRPLLAAPSEPVTVNIEVIDVAGGRAYLKPGEDAGLRAGGQVQIERQTFSIASVSAGTVMIELQKRSLKRGDKGRARVSTHAQAPAAERKKMPRELGAFVGQWPKPVPPAASQHPKPVPLGPAAQAAGQTFASLTLRAAGSLPLSAAGSNWARGELRGRLRAEPFQGLPLRLDLDAALQLWAASGASYDRSSASRPLLRVRALELAYGQNTGLLAAAGRLRYAASTLGQLDGLKLQAPLVAGLQLSAFGGLIPDPLSGKPTTDSARFGGELSWEDLSASLRPRLSLVAQATRFNGALDERRLHLTADVFPGRNHLGAYVLGSLFDRDNPWNARAQELSAAGASFELRFGELHVSGRFDMRRPERSRWLATFLPPGWFCTQRSSSSGQDVCRGSDARFLAQGDVGLYRPNLALNAGVSLSRSRYADSEQLAGFANASFLRVVQALHLDAGVFAQTGSLIRSAALSVGAGMLLANDNLDLSLSYRPALTRYHADTSAFVEHTLGASVLWLLGTNLSLQLAADAIAGRDLSVLLVQSTLQWRPG